MSLSNSTDYVAKLNAAFYNMQSSLLTKDELTNYSMHREGNKDFKQINIFKKFMFR